MIQAVISGYGRMGHMVEAALARVGIPCVGKSEDIASFDPDLARESVCIDFTTPAAFRTHYKALARLFRAVVVGTTGWDDIRDEVVAEFERQGTPMVYASNFSVGVNVFSAAVDVAAKYLSRAGGYDAYVVEKHHIHKLDAPSGTAKSLAGVIRSHTGVEPPVASVRVGELAGTHTVGFEGKADRITLEHEAFSREGFAEGAVLAARMTEGLTGVHLFKDLFFKEEQR